MQRTFLQSQLAFGFQLGKLLVTLKVTPPATFSKSRMVRDRFGLLQIESQRPTNTLRSFLLSESRRSLPHPHNRLVIDSSATRPTTPLGAGEPTRLRIEDRPVLRRHVAKLLRRLR